MAENKDSVAVLVDDMFFIAKIITAAAAAERSIVRVKSRDLLERLAAEPPSLIIIDLNSDKLDPIEAISFLKSSEELRTVPIVSFVSHVQTDLIQAAQAAGSDYVLPRSAFSQMLPRIIAGDIGSKR